MGDMSTGRQEAFEIFKRDYTQNSNIEDNKDALKAKYVEAKKLGEYVNKSRTKISKFLCTGACITCIFEDSCSLLYIKRLYNMLTFKDAIIY